MSRHDTAPVIAGWRAVVFKNRGLLLLPVAIVLVVFGRPSVHSALIGIAIAGAGEALRVWAVGYSGATTRAEVVTAPELVTAGPYSRIRNPLYAGNVIIAVGFWIAFSGKVALAQVVIMLLVVLLLVVGVYAIIVPLEESYLAATFGSTYARYKESVPRIVPGFHPLARAERRGRWRWEVILRAEVITLAYLVLMAAAVIVELRI